MRDCAPSAAPAAGGAAKLAATLHLSLPDWVQGSPYKKHATYYPSLVRLNRVKRRTVAHFGLMLGWRRRKSGRGSSSEFHLSSLGLPLGNSKGSSQLTRLAILY